MLIARLGEKKRGQIYLPRTHMRTSQEQTKKRIRERKDGKIMKGV
jgi:hypothetical protein